MAWPYGIDFLYIDLWYELVCKHWHVSVDFENKLVIKLLSILFFDIDTSKN